SVSYDFSSLACCSLSLPVCSSFLFSRLPPPPRSTLFPYTTLFRSKPLHSHNSYLSIWKSSHHLSITFICNKCDGSRFSDSKITRSEEHTSELQSRFDLVCRLLLEKKKKRK